MVKMHVENVVVLSCLTIKMVILEKPSQIHFFSNIITVTRWSRVQLKKYHISSVVTICYGLYSKND